MSIVIITGDHPRHKYLVSCLAKTGLVSAWIKETRESFLPEPPDHLSAELSDLFRRHFALRDTAEQEFFSTAETPHVPTLEVSLKELNAPQTVTFAAKFAPKLVLSYGCHKLSQTFLNGIDAKFWNTHGGLSPEYRGVTTHFWPSYFLEPQMTGVTLHETTDHLDGGAVIFQSAGEMVRGDGLHQLAARTVKSYAEQLSERLRNLDFNALPDGQPQKTYGRVFRVVDWRPEHLDLIYNQYEDRIVDALLDGRIEGREPTLVSVI